MRISDGSSDVCSSDLEEARVRIAQDGLSRARITWIEDVRKWHPGQDWIWKPGGFGVFDPGINALSLASLLFPGPLTVRSEEHTSELQSLMRISYAVFCLKKKKQQI